MTDEDRPGPAIAVTLGLVMVVLAGALGWAALLLVRAAGI